MSWWDEHPCNALNATAGRGTREWFDQIDQRKRLAEPHMLRFACPYLWTGGRVYDAGCGIGTATGWFLRGGAKVFAADLSETAVGLARRNHPAALVWRGDIAEVLGERANLVWCWGVLQHTAKPERVLAKLRENVLPFGELRLMVYHRYSWKRLMIAFGLDRWEASEGVPVVRTWSRRGIERLLCRTGWQPVEVTVDHIFRWKIAPYRREGRLEPRALWRLVPKRPVKLLERWFGWHLMIVARPM